MRSLQEVLASYKGAWVPLGSLGFPRVPSTSPTSSRSTNRLRCEKFITQTITEDVLSRKTPTCCSSHDSSDEIDARRSDFTINDRNFAIHLKFCNPMQFLRATDVSPIYSSGSGERMKQAIGGKRNSLAVKRF